MRKSDLHRSLQSTCVPIPGRSGCFAVVPPVAPHSIDVPSCHALMTLAKVALEDLAVAMKRNPPQAELLLWMLNRREAVDSSQIEGTKTGFDGLLLHELSADSETAAQNNPDANETLAYVHAFTLGASAVGRDGKKAVTSTLLLKIHAELMAGQDRINPGKFREVQNFIGSRFETASYIPPPASEVSWLMDDLNTLLQYEAEGVMETSILMRGAIAHAQFEAIHPFLDGNGRVGRLLLPLMFQAEGQPPIHLATFLKVRQREYYDALNAVQTRLNWEPWLRLFLECVVASSQHTIQLLDDLQSIQTGWQDQLRSAKKRKDAAAWKLIDWLIGQPVVTVNQIVNRLGISFPAANQAVDELMALDILRAATDQRRHRVFHAHAVMNALYTGLDTVLERASRF
jgi:Fic family protein